MNKQLRIEQLKQQIEKLKSTKKKGNAFVIKEKEAFLKELEGGK